MNKKLTIGVATDPYLQKALYKQVQKLRDLPMRLHAPESYHIPLMQLGWVHEDLVDEIIIALSDMASEQEMIPMQFEQIAPQWKKKEQRGELAHANALWCKGQATQEMRDLYEAIRSALGMHGEPVKSFAPHIVLGQMRAQAWQTYQDEVGPYPQLTIDFPVESDVSSLTLFEHTTIEGKKEFLPLEEFLLQ